MTTAYISYSDKLFIEYIKKHIDWFLKNHPDRVTSFLEDVNTKYSNKRESLQMEFVF